MSTHTDHELERPSKTQRKQAMAELQALGEALVDLPADRLKKVALPDELRTAVLEAQRMPRQDEAKRRQMQYIGKIMRNEDTAPIIEKLKQLKGSSTAATALLHRIERYRTEMIANDAAITQFLADFPAVDAQPLRALVRNARKEAEQVKPPKAYRELFQLIKTALETPVDDDDGVGITDNSIEE